MATVNQTADQGTKGGILGIITYLLIKYNVDPALTALSLPVLAVALSWASTKVGDPNVAAFFGANDSKPLNLTNYKPAPVKAASAKKAPAKKAPAKKKK